MVDVSKLKRITTYAYTVKKSRTWVIKMIELGKLKCISIDGIKYIVTE